MLQHFFTFKIYKYNDYVTTVTIKYAEHIILQQPLKLEF